MIKQIIEMLEIATENKIQGEHIDVALGKNKIPENFKEVLKLRLLKNG
jgi:hypothetical protein|tara:strand:- start:305 stop:448 length:144 start_codon:yes stop_codon:yes gene_type:complete